MTPRFLSHAQNQLRSRAQNRFHTEQLRSQASNLLRSAFSHARRPSRVTLGVGAATLATVGGVWGGLAATSSPGVAAAAAADSAAHAPAIHAGPSASAAVHPGTPASASHRASVLHAVSASSGHSPAAQRSHAEPAVSQSARHTAAASHQQVAATHAAKSTGHVAVKARAAAVAAHTGRHAAAAAAPSHPYTIYDSVTPSAIPAGHEVATYATGPFAVQASQVAGRKVLWIDTQGTDPNAAALDVEPGDATPAVAAAWTQAKLSAHPRYDAIIYTMQSEWPAAQAAIAGLPHWMVHHIRWWIADPTGVPHVLPGASATQWYWGSNYDITTATPGF